MSFKIGDRNIGFDYPPYIIADACNNFNNDVEAAKDLCDQAKAVGVDAIKFQMRLQRDRLSPAQHAEVAKYCDEIEITWLCSAFDEEGFRFVNAIGVPVNKIPSGQMTNHALIETVCEYERPLIISTGMSDWLDIRKLESAMRRMHTKVPYSVLQCTSIYPCPYNKVDLYVLKSLRGLYWSNVIPIGLSDHTPTIWTSIGAVALGARIIEKHITKNVRAEGPDHAASITPTRFAQLVEGCRAVFEARGTTKTFHDEEREKAKVHRWNYT